MRALAKRALKTAGFDVRRTIGTAQPSTLEPTLELVAAHRMVQTGRPLRFVQIGAYDGVSNDPVHHLIRAHGWQGVLVEPQHAYFNLLQGNYADVPGVRFLNAAVADEPGVRVLYTVRPRDDHPAWVAQTASFLREPLLELGPQLPGGVEIDETPVQAVALRDLLDPMPDLLQIDVEGYDAEVVRMLDLADAPAIIRYEHKHLATEDHHATVRLLTNAGYLIHVERSDVLAYRAVYSRSSTS